MDEDTGRTGVDGEVKGDPIPPENHAVRYVRGGLVDRGEVDGAAFVRKPDHEGLSVNCLESFGGDSVEHRIDALRWHIQLELGSTAVFAKLNVGQTKIAVAEKSPLYLQIAFVHDPQGSKPPKYLFDDPSHALIAGLPASDEPETALVIGDMIRNTIIDTYPAKTA